MSLEVSSFPKDKAVSPRLLLIRLSTAILEVERGSLFEALLSYDTVSSLVTLSK
jgi:hypothetical protein